MVERKAPRRTENYDRLYGSIDYDGKTVLDIGADYGSTAEFFLSNKAKKVIAVEGDDRYFEELRDYAKNKPVHAINMFVDSGSDIDSLLTIERVDVAKVDCEGCEKYLFELPNSKIENIPEWFIELHFDEKLIDRFKKKFKNFDIRLVREWKRTKKPGKSVWLYYAKLVEPVSFGDRIYRFAAEIARNRPYPYFQSNWDKWPFKRLKPGKHTFSGRMVKKRGPSRLYLEHEASLEVEVGDMWRFKNTLSLREDEKVTTSKTWMMLKPPFRTCAVKTGDEVFDFDCKGAPTTPTGKQFSVIFKTGEPIRWVWFPEFAIVPVRQEPNAGFALLRANDFSILELIFRWIGGPSAEYVGGRLRMPKGEYLTELHVLHSKTQGEVDEYAESVAG